MSETVNNSLLSLSQVADVFDVTTRTIQRWVSKRKIPQPIRPGGIHGKPYWMRKDINLFVKAGSIHAYRRERRAR